MGLYIFLKTALAVVNVSLFVVFRFPPVLDFGVRGSGSGLKVRFLDRVALSGLRGFGQRVESLAGFGGDSAVLWVMVSGAAANFV